MRGFLAGGALAAGSVPAAASLLLLPLLPARVFFRPRLGAVGSGGAEGLGVRAMASGVWHPNRLRNYLVYSVTLNAAMGDCLAPVAWLSPWPASSRAGAPAREAAASYLYLYLYLYLGRYSAFGCVRSRSGSVSLRSGSRAGGRNHPTTSAGPASRSYLSESISEAARVQALVRVHETGRLQIVENGYC